MNTVKAPDFAYPETVTANAEKTLKQAIAASDGKAVVRSLMNIALAQGAIGNDQLQPVVKRIEEIRASESDPVTASLLDLLLADIYYSVYNGDEYKYNTREIPLTPLSADYTEWSGQQFRMHIDSLCISALTAPEALQAQKLADYTDIISSTAQTRVYYPTVYDFAAYKSIQIRSRLSAFSNVFSLLYLCPERLFVVTPKFAPSSAVATGVLDTYAQWLKFHADDVAPLINVDVQRINTVAQGVYYSLNDSAESRRFAALRELYKRFEASEYSCEALLAMSSSQCTDVETHPENAAWLYSAMNAALKRYPAYMRAACLKQCISSMERKEFRVTTPIYASPGRSFDLNVSGVNTASVTVDIYRIKDELSTDSYYNMQAHPASERRLVKSVTVDMPGTVPYKAEATEAVSLPEEGIYIAVPRALDGAKEARSYRKIYCSKLSLASMQLNNTVAIVVDPLTGAPVSEATLMASLRSGKSYVWVEQGKTDSRGFRDIADGQSTQMIPVKGTDRYAAPRYVESYKQYSERTDTIAMTYTDLSIYHPGDSVVWVSVLYAPEVDTRRLVPGVEITATLTGTNGSEVGRMKTVTDSYGRATGRFVIPAGDLTGTYRIYILREDGRRAGSAQFMVSDYKMPTFAVSVTETAKGVPAQGCVTLKGKAMTYSGVAVSGGEAKLELSVAQRYWWRMSNDVPFYSATMRTSADGSFSFELPKEVIDNSPAPNGYFTARITVTSISGESRQTMTSFTMGPTYEIVASIPSNIDVSSATHLDVKVIDGTGSAVPMDVAYRLVSNRTKEVVCDGTFRTSNPVVDWSKVPGGSYRVTFALKDMADADSAVCTPVMIYRPSDAMPPSDAPVWVPDAGKRIAVTAKRKATLLYGTSADEAYVLYTLWTPERIIEQRWLRSKPGIHKLDVKLPDGEDNATVNLSATYNFKNATATVKIYDAQAEKSLTIVTETFRDRIEPGAGERWTFRSVGHDGNGTASAMILGMYNAALDMFGTQTWRMSPHSLARPSFRWNGPDLDGNTYVSFASPYISSDCSDISAPEFEMYGMSFRREVLYKLHTTSLAMSRAPMAGVAVAEESVVNEAKDLAADEVVNVEEHKEAVTADTGGTEEAEESPADKAASADDFTYRQGEVPLAFFCPTLNTDAEGRIEFSFTAPDANTTWRFNAMAFTPDVLTASLTRDVLASKQVMVQPNLPRFLRCGDRVRIEANVMNNSDEERAITATTEIFNPASGAIVATADTVITIAAGASAVTGYELTAPYDAPFIGYRVKARSDNYADGEQALIPLLPYTTPVIETVPFYMSPDSASMAVTLPEMKQDARVTLQYCENPAWYVVTALPGLSADEPRTSPDIAADIYSAAIAEGLLKDYPAIADALRYWTGSDRSDSTLVSMLERNTDLKTVLLRATPWMMDARSDTERMERLALLFDSKRIKEVYGKCTDMLEKLVRSDGGWAWSTYGDESSVWATETVLRLLGRLNTLGYMPSEKRLSAMIPAALKCVETETGKSYRKYPKLDYTSFVTLLDMWPSYTPNTLSQKIISATVQRTLNGWKKYDVSGKAVAALLLARHGYKSTAKTVLTSLRQYARQTPAQGMWWPSVGDALGGTMQQLAISASALEAFAAIEPESKDVDAIRQWLILQKETRNWGSSALASDIIASFLTTSPKWIKKAEGSVITLGTRMLTPNDIDSRLGYFRMDISADNPSGAVLRVERKGETPSWGAVYCQYTDVMRDVKAASCEAVSVEKRFYKKVGTQWVAATDLKVGDRVKVELLIHANRDIEYVAITDDRAACLEPVEQLPGTIWSDGVCFYRENGDSSTNMFVSRMPKGAYLLGYELWVNNAGSFASGLATLQSQYAPQITAHSSGTVLECRR
ncbi:MAG: MG2 domain-containing protein [Muribaculaceae bacterium]|nr:MG2 domain-containing protein [Muribaculaceae bacterium]